MLTYSLAAAAIQGGNAFPEVRRHINDSIARLTKGGVKPGPQNATLLLQNSRTYKFARPESASRWGAFPLADNSDRRPGIDTNVRREALGRRCSGD